MTHAHDLVLVGVDEVKVDTKDDDPLIDSPFFETRVKFLNLCQVRSCFLVVALLVFILGCLTT